MMRLVFLLYAEEQRLLPVSSDLYASAYSVTGLHHQLDADQKPLRGRDRRPPRRRLAPPARHLRRRLRRLRVRQHAHSALQRRAVRPGTLSLAGAARRHRPGRPRDPGRTAHPPVRRGGATERLSYKGLDVEQIGHVYEGLLEFYCLRVVEPYLGLIGKLEPELPLAQVELAAEDDGFFEWLAKICDASPGTLRKAMGAASEDLATLHAACDNDADSSARRAPATARLASP